MTISERNSDFLKFLCSRGWRERNIRNRAEKFASEVDLPVEKILSVYLKRLKMELAEFDRRGVVDYFLIVRDVVAEARRRDIMVGPGRGSAAGSLALYLLGITDVDPIRHGLMFERFMAPGRIDLPDVDIDFEDRRRNELFEYLIEKYGEDHFARVGSFTTIGSKLIVRDLGRVMLIGMSDVEKAAEAIDRTLTLQENIEENEVVKNFFERYPDARRYGETIEGHVRSLTVHAAGVVVSPVPVAEIVPVEVRGGETVTAFDMHGVQDRGLLKLDLLGLKNLSIIKDAVEAVKMTTGREIDLSTLELDDEKALDTFTKGDFLGVFQFDTHSAATICRGVEFVDFDTIVAMTSLNRPGTSRSGLAQTYLERNADPEKIESVHPIYDMITEETLGVPVYQEHVIKLCRQLGGFTAEDADKVRKLIGKSKGAAALRPYAEAFIEGATYRGMSSMKSTELWDQLCEFGGYSFNKSHATGYSVIAYWTQYLKAHYPECFFWGLIRNEKKEEKILTFTKEAEERGVRIIPPDVQFAGSDYRIEKKGIVPSLIDIKYVSSKAVVEIEKAQPFKDFVDFLERAPAAGNKRVTESLVKAGAMRELIPNTKIFLEYVEKLWKTKKKKDGLDKVRKFIEASKKHDDFEEDDLRDLAASVNPFVIRTHPLKKHAALIEEVVKVKLVPPEKIESRNDGFFVGALTEVDVRELIDKSGDAKTYAVLTIDGGGVRPNKFKLDYDLYPLYPLDRLEGEIVVVHYHRSYKIGNLQFIVSVPELAAVLKDGAKLNVFEQIVRKHFPARARVLTNIRLHRDRKKREMAFITVMGPGKALEGVCFSSTWLDVRDDLAPGVPVKVHVKREEYAGRVSTIFNNIERAEMP